MMEKCKSLLYNFDLIGTTPLLFIFKNKRYKSILSSLISITIIIFSLIFAIYSLNEYLKYDNPFIVYSKINDEETERNIFLNETPLMFQIVNLSIEKIEESIAYFEADYVEVYDNGTVYGTLLTIEKCKLGKNIDSKYQDLFYKKSSYGRNIEEFYCFGKSNENISLFYNPHIGFSFINLHIIIKKNNDYTPEKLYILIISESDLILHNNKLKPISKNYIFQTIAGFNSLEYTNINYNFQYVKYETDDGLFYPSYKNENGMSFSDMIYFRNMIDSYNLNNNLEKSNSSRIGTIIFGINKSNFDNYKRSYKRIQSLLADVMSVVSLFFEIGRQIINFLCEKRMTGDIVSNLLQKNKKNLISQQNNDINKLFKNKEKSVISSSERKNIKKELIGKTSNTDNKSYNDEIGLNKSISNNNNGKLIKKINLKTKIINKINYFNIIKSYFCFKDNKSELINLCYDIIIEDMSIERILKRIYDLENLYNFFSSEEKEKLTAIKNKRFKEINKYIHKIKNEKKRDKNIKDKIKKKNIDKNSKENQEFEEIK